MHLLQFSARVEGGKVKIRNLREFEAALSAWPDGEVLVSIEKMHATRSLAANAWYWAVILRALSEHTGYTVEEMHEVCKLRFNAKLIDIVDKDGVVIGEERIGQSTARLNKIQFGEYTEQIRQWAAETFALDIPDPDPNWREHAA